MYRNIYLLLFFTLSISLIRAQTVTSGIKAGLNLSRLSFSQPNDPDVSNTWRPSFHVGGFIRKAISEQTAIRAELLYSGKGCQFKQVSGDGYLRLHYLSLPVLLDLQVNKKLAVEVGPEFNYLLNTANLLYNHKFDLGIDVGIRYRFNQAIELGLRYNYGVSGVARVDLGSGLKPVRNQALQLSLAYNLAK